MTNEISSPSISKAETALDLELARDDDEDGARDFFWSRNANSKGIDPDGGPSTDDEGTTTLFDDGSVFVAETFSAFANVAAFVASKNAERANLSAGELLAEAFDRNDEAEIARLSATAFALGEFSAFFRDGSAFFAFGSRTRLAPANGKILAALVLSGSFPVGEDVETALGVEEADLSATFEKILGPEAFAFLVAARSGEEADERGTGFDRGSW